MSKAQSAKKREGIHYGWICATGGLSSQFVYEIPLGIYPLVMASMMIALGMTIAEAGLIISMSGVTLVVGSPAWGAIVSKIGLRKALTIGSIVLSIGTIGMGIAPSAIIAGAFYSITGFGGAAVMVISNVIVGTWFHARRRGVINGYLNSTPSLLSAALGIIVPALLIAYDWRFVWYLWGGISLLLSGVVFALVRNSPKDKGLSRCGAPLEAEAKSEGVIPQAGTQERVKSSDVLKMGITWHLSIVLILITMMWISVASFLPVYIILQVGLSVVVAGLAIAIFSLAGLVGGFAWGFISDHIPRKIAMLGAVCIFIVSLLALIYFGTETTIIYVLSGIMGFAVACGVISFAMVPDYFPVKVLGTASGVINAMCGLGMVITPFLIGYVAEITGSYVPAFEVVVLFAVAETIAVLILRKPKY